MRQPSKMQPDQLAQEKPPYLIKTDPKALLRPANQSKALQDDIRRGAEQSQQ
jgi:hypothetical protein